MKIGILNRPDIEELATRPFKEKTALISITDYDDEYAELEFKPEYLLHKEPVLPDIHLQPHLCPFHGIRPMWSL